MRSPILLVLVVGGVGCGRTHPERGPVPLPARFVATSDTTAVPAEPPSSFAAWSDDGPLREILALAFRDAPSLAEARARVAEARARRRDAVWQLAPSVTGSASYTRVQLSGSTLAVPGAPRRFNAYDVGGVATWEVDIFGRLRRQLGARTALVGAAAADRETVRIGLTAEIASTYFTVRELDLRLRVARDNAENQRRTLQLTEQRLEAGRGTAFDVRRARAQFAATSATIPGLEAEGAAVRAALAALAGQLPGAFDRVLAQEAPLPVPNTTLSSGTPASLLARRPDVRSAERTLAAARASAGAASARLLPRLTLGAELGSTSLESDGLLKSGNGRYAVGPVLSWPVLNLGRLFADRDIAAAQGEQAEAAYRAATLFALQETEAALRRYRGASEALTSLEEAATASAEATALATLRYQEGVTDFLQVLDALRTQLESEDRLVRGRGDFSRALVELYRSLAADGHSE